ncbi:flagellin [Selenomonas sp. CM52]|uniref:flagellin N-terminal helical domain-containing protein n=1 Tax=Selenomonas sp. CM52 TaxID=936381 RepID=UPI00027C400C|nr:flagellin [Selenomonas sp. CM52]EJU27621.1 flagellin N-terminal domain protein [Selenomonas sp. CM52]
MALVVKNNMMAVNTLNTLNKNQSALSTSLKQVSSGMKINGAVDDASGYAISERMRVQIRSLDQDNQNTQNGNSMMKVAEGAVSSTVDILKTLKEKVINAANDTNTDDDRLTIQKELNQSIDQINDNANITFNGKYLVDGTHNQKVTATTTTFTNQAMSTATEATSALTGLLDRTGRNLNIHSQDTITVSYVNQGKTVTTSFTVSTCTFKDIIGKISGVGKMAAAVGASSIIGTNVAGDTVYTASGESAVSIYAGGTGVGNSIGGITFSITDTQGNINKSANAVLDAFSETVRAQDNSQDNSMNFQIGTRANQAIRVGMTDMRAQALGLQGSDGSTLNISTRDKANAAINVLDNAISKALDQQTTIGAVQSRLNYTSQNLTTASENVQASESTIRDADMAKAMTNYTKNNVLMQAAQAMLAQANQSSSGVLSLLQ